uniref:Phosphodiesterase n=1 Tax=Parastrongyloides trichosuri TaxID=131310 RepID=A0A0N4ZB52_PARTI
MSQNIEKSKKSGSIPNLNNDKICNNIRAASNTLSSTDHRPQTGKCLTCGREYKCSCCEHCIHESSSKTQSSSTQMAFITFSTVTNATGLPDVVVEPQGRASRSSLPTNKATAISSKMDAVQKDSENCVNAQPSVTSSSNSIDTNCIPSIAPSIESEVSIGASNVVGTLITNQPIVSQQNNAVENVVPSSTVQPGHVEAPVDQQPVEQVPAIPVNNDQGPGNQVPLNVPPNNQPQIVRDHNPQELARHAIENQGPAEIIAANPVNNRRRINIVEEIYQVNSTNRYYLYEDFVSARRICVCTRCGNHNEIAVIPVASFQIIPARRYPQFSHDSFVTNLITDICNDNALDNLHEWAFPIFNYAFSYPERILSRMAYRIFDNCNLFNIFRIDRKKFFHYFCALESGYWDIPYHNRIHAADVLHACYYLTVHPIEPIKNINGGYSNPIYTKALQGLCHHSENTPFIASMNNIEVLAFYSAAAMHDFDHPGRTNAFMVATYHDMASLYNDRSVLENHHAAMSWRLLRRKENFFLENMDVNDLKKFRFLVVEYILATDLRHHFEHIANFDKFQEVNLNVESSRHNTLKVLMKCADICSPLKPNLLHREWTRRIVEEFHTQGDEEKALGMPVSPFMDRNDPNIEALQHNFIKQMVTPLANALNDQNMFPILPGLGQSELMINLNFNERYWHNLIRIKNGNLVDEDDDEEEENDDEEDEEDEGVVNGDGNHREEQ